jgi:hypothetical protein
MREELSHPPFTVVPPGLQNNAQAGLPSLVPMSRIGTKHLDSTSRPHSEPFEDLDGRRLPRPVRPKQAHHFAPARLKTDAMKHVSGAVAHPQGVDVDYDVPDRHRLCSRLDTRVKTSADRPATVPPDRSANPSDEALFDTENALHYEHVFGRDALD